MSHPLRSSALPVEQIRLRQVFANAGKDCVIPRPPGLFLPLDPWTRTFARGLEAAAEEGIFKKKKVLEMGAGTGVIMAGMHTMKKDGPAHYTGVDIIPDAIEACRNLAKRYGWDVDLFPSYLLRSIPEEMLAQIDEIIGCVPSAIKKDIDLKDPHDAANYCPPDTLPFYDRVGLNATFAQQARLKAPTANIMLNVATRPTLQTIFDMLEHYGFVNPRRIGSEVVVQQDFGTGLQSYIDAEDRGFPYEGYSDPEARNRITAEEAEGKRVRGVPTYHKVCVVRAEAPKV